MNGRSGFSCAGSVVRKGTAVVCARKNTEYILCNAIRYSGAATAFLIPDPATSQFAALSKSPALQHSGELSNQTRQNNPPHHL